MKTLIILLLALAGIPDRESAILLLSGAGTMEELSESEVEAYMALCRNPVRINLASRNRLLSCGLFSPYQVASLLEYRERTGDILSFTELATVNGIGEERAQALRHFTSLESRSPPGKARRGDLRQDALARLSVKDDACSFAGKYHISAGEDAECYLSGRNSYTDAEPKLNAASLAVYGKSGWKTVLGDFNARFGQGLLCWSGLSLSGFPSVQAMLRNGTGISPTGSFSPGHRGIALDWTGSGWGAAAACSFKGMALGSLSFFGRTGDYSLCLARLEDGRTAGSAGWKQGFGHLLFYGEAAFAAAENGKGAAPALLAGLAWTPAYRVSAGLLARYYSPDYSTGISGAARTGSKVSDEAALTAGLRYRDFSVTVDRAIHPRRIEEGKKNSRRFKGVFSYTPELHLAALDVAPGLRWTEKCDASPSGKDWRHELRADLKLRIRGMEGGVRGDAVRAGESGSGLLAFCEAGYKTPSDSARLRFSLFARGVFFDTSDWNNRIYVYERDLPGCFSVPAYYGRGRAFSLNAGISFNSRRSFHRLEASASFTRSDKSSKTVFKIQYRIQMTGRHRPADNSLRVEDWSKK